MRVRANIDDELDPNSFLPPTKNGKSGVKAARCWTGGRGSSMVAFRADCANRIPDIEPFPSHGRLYIKRKTAMSHLGERPSTGIRNGSEIVRMLPTAIVRIIPDLVGAPLPCIHAVGNAQRFGVGRASLVWRDRKLHGAGERREVITAHPGSREKCDSLVAPATRAQISPPCG